MSEPETNSQEASIRLLDAAMGEFKRFGVVTETRCDNCSGTITVTQIADEAWTMSCPCGRFRGTLRGL